MARKLCCGGTPARIEQRRRRVIDAARALFCRHGFHATGMAQISAEAGIKVGQIYRDFCGKDAIVTEIIHADLARRLDEAALDRAIGEGDGAAIRAWLAALITRECGLTGQQDLLPEIVAEAARSPSVALVLREADGHVLRRLDAALLALAPEPAKEARRRALADLALTLLMGVPNRLLALTKDEAERMGAAITALMAREIDRLVA